MNEDLYQLCDSQGYTGPKKSKEHTQAQGDQARDMRALVTCRRVFSPSLASLSPFHHHLLSASLSPSRARYVAVLGGFHTSSDTLAAA